jgi:hypothetical protein
MDVTLVSQYDIISRNNPLPIASKPFAPAGAVNAAATHVSSRVALPAGSTVRVYNLGPARVRIAFGDSTVTASASANHPVLPNEVDSLFREPSTVTHAAVITESDGDVATVIFSCGEGQ